MSRVSTAPLRGALLRATTLLLAVAVLFPAAPSAVETAAHVPAGFRQTIVARGLEAPTSFAPLPDGRILVAEHAGVVRVVAGGRVLPRPFLELGDRVNNAGERGLVAIAAGPHFRRNGFVYLLYAWEDDPRRPRAPKGMRLTRVTARGAVAVPGSEVVLLGKATSGDCAALAPGADCIPTNCRCHGGGDIRFAPDGTLFVSTGDGATAGGPDPNALRAQELDSLAGKLLRVTPSGAGLPGNPFWNGRRAANRSKVWALGLRNPLRFSLRAGIPWVGDVGWRRFEEVNAAPAGANLGWPCYEGAAPAKEYAAAAACRRLPAAEAAAPAYVYPHRGKPASVTGGDFAPARWPRPFAGAYFFADFARGWIRTLRIGGDPRPVAFASGGDGPVALRFASDGTLLLLSFLTGELRRIEYEPDPQTTSRP